MSVISVCKNVIASNNKKGWADPTPPIRVARTPSGKVTNRYHRCGIVDAEGNIVAEVISSTDGKPVIKCGAKVGIKTKYDVVGLD